MARPNIALVGAMNTGKSTALNVLTQQAAALVDSTAGTTADPKSVLMELHDFGPIKVVDTPGFDEGSSLGLKKRDKTIDVLKASDVAVVVVRPEEKKTVETAREVLSLLPEVGAANDTKVVLLFNLTSASLPDNLNKTLEEIETSLNLQKNKRFLGSLALDLTLPQSQGRLLNFVKDKVKSLSAQAPPAPEYIPSTVPLDENSMVMFVVIMDEPSPVYRLKKPQTYSQWQLLNRYVNTYEHRVNLEELKAGQVDKEKERFLQNYRLLRSSGRLKLVISESHVAEYVHRWTAEADATPSSPSLSTPAAGSQVPLTTFSLLVANHQSGGQLGTFVDGLKVIDLWDQTPDKKKKILLCEACTHDRLVDDIGTKVLPEKLKKKYGDSVIVEHAFGREVEARNLRDYDLIVHCGGCMLDEQQMKSRVSDITSSGVPVTNYGLLLSKLSSTEVLARVLEPWKVQQ